MAFLSLSFEEVMKQRNLVLSAAEMLILLSFSAIRQVLNGKLKTQRMLRAIKMSARIKQAGFNYLNELA